MLICLFLTGLGVVLQPSERGIHSSFSDQWGNLSDIILSNASFARAYGLSGCDRAYYLRTDTTSRGWNDSSLQQETCDAIVRTGANVLFTHSMSTLVVGDALYRDELDGCRKHQIGRSPSHVTRWFAMSPPFAGSETAGILHDAALCSYSGMRELLSFRCEAGENGHQLAPAFRSVLPSVKHTMQHRLSLFQEHVSGAVCGYQPIAPLFVSSDSGNSLSPAPNVHAATADWLHVLRAYAEKLVFDSVLSVIAFVAYRSPSSAPSFTAAEPEHSFLLGNDGLISYDSCVAPFGHHQFRTVPHHRWYSVAANHRDLLCGFFGSVSDSPATNFQPCLWLLHMTELARVSFHASGKHVLAHSSPSHSQAPPLTSVSGTQTYFFRLWALLLSLLCFFVLASFQCFRFFCRRASNEF
jgi:hypothetical protein